MHTTPPATKRAEYSLTGFGNLNSECIHLKSMRVQVKTHHLFDNLYPITSYSFVITARIYNQHLAIWLFEAEGRHVFKGTHIKRI